MCRTKGNSIMKYYGILPEHKPWVRGAVGALGCYMVFYSITHGEWYFIPIGLLVVLSVFFFKKFEVSEAGVDIVSHRLGMTRHDLWTWDMVTSLHTDYHAAAPNVQCHFGRDIVTRTFVVSYEDSQAILELAARMNPDMFIQDMNEEEEARLAENARKYQEKLAAEKARKKAARAAKRKKS